MSTPSGVAATPPRPLTPQEREELATRAHERERSIIEKCKLFCGTGLYLGRDFHESIEARDWQWLGYDSLNQFLATPEIPFSRGYVFKLRRVYRRVCLEGGMPIEEVAGVPIERLQAGLPALTAGRVGVEDLVSDARENNPDELKRLYERGKDAPIDPEEEPERHSCPECGQSHVVKGAEA